jgi:hypothetical protein
MTGLPPAYRPAVILEVGGLKDWQSPPGFSVISSLCLSSKLDGSAPKRQNLREAEVCQSLVGMTGFEPATPASRTQCATGLRYIPIRYSNRSIKIDPKKEGPLAESVNRCKSNPPASRK